jgi:hypothetical protein
MLLGKEDGVVGHSPAHVRAVAEAHIAAYRPCDIETLMASVSPKGGIWAGLAPPAGVAMMRTADEIRKVYVGLLDAVKVGQENVHVAVATDWYVFFESSGKVTDRASGHDIETRSIDLFGNDEYGTAIDMAWPFAAASGLDGSTAAGAVIDRQERATAHRLRMQGLVSGNLQQATQGISPEARLFLPCFDPNDKRLELYVRGDAAYHQYVTSLFDFYRLEGRGLSNQVAGALPYAFSENELLLTPRQGPPLKVRYALAEIFDDRGLVVGALGFASRKP